MYILLAGYSSISEFIYYPFSVYLQYMNYEGAEDYMSYLYLPWILKPFFGFLVDRLHPFKYRIKGFLLILATINGIVSVLLLLVIRNEDENPFYPFLLVILLFTSLGFIDSIARSLELMKEGMTSTTLKFEERLVHLQNNRPRSMKVRISYFSNYLRYLIARTFFRSVLELLGPLILDYYGSSAKEEAHDVHIIFGIVGGFSLYLLFHTQVFFSELKVRVV